MTTLDYESDELLTDDEYARDGLTGQLAMPSGYTSSPTEANATPTSRTASKQNTPRNTRLNNAQEGFPNMSLPRERINLWNTRQCAEFVASLGGAFQEYAHNVIDEGIAGDVFVTMLHDDLKELGVDSMGHRLTILKAIYEVKIRHKIPIEIDQFVPLSVGVNAAAHGRITQEDINSILYQIKSRDARILATEAELKTVKYHLDRVFEDTKRLREDMLPVARAVKNSQPLPPAPDAAMTIPTITNTTHLDGPIHSTPLHSTLIRGHSTPLHSASMYPPPNKPPPGPPPMPNMIDIKPQSEGLSRSLSRKLSTKRFPFSSASSKVPSPTIIRETPGLEAHATSNQTHLAPATFGQSQQPSPTSPPYTINTATTMSSSRRGGSGVSKSANPESWAESYASSLASDPRLTTHTHTPNSALLPPTRRAPYPTPSSATLNTTLLHHSSSANDHSTVQNFKLSEAETTTQVLPVAMRKWRINGNPRDYNLYIVNGNDERLLQSHERPLELFKTYQKRKGNPMFMLRRVGGGPPIGGVEGEMGGMVGGKLVPGGTF